MTLALDAYDLDEEEIERRFAWARARVQPQWLWPDIDPERWRRATIWIEAAIRPILAGGRAGTALDGDARAMGLAGYISGMGPLLGHWLEAGLLDATPAIADMLALQLRHNAIRMERLADRAAAAADTLADAGVTPVFLKGMHSAFAYFPNPATRPCSDIDMLIKQSELPAAEAALARTGYQAGPPAPLTLQRSWKAASAPTRPRSLIFVHADDPWSLDVQPSLDQYFSDVNAARLQDLAEPAAFEPWPVSARARVLGQPLLILQLATHASHDLDSLTLLRLVELIWVIRLDLAAGRLSWEAFLDAGRRIDSLGFAFPALKFAEALNPGLIPSDVLAECEARCPAEVRRLLRRLTPATAHRVGRWSLREQYMWSRTWRSRFRQTAAYLTPGDDRQGLAEKLAFYGWRMRRGFRAAARW